MKKFIPQPNLPKTKELRQLEIEQRKQQTFSSQILSTDQQKNQIAESSSAKEPEISYVVKGKSDIIVSFDEEYLAPVISQKKTYEFRS
jgi:hypothetical protein